MLVPFNTLPNNARVWIYQSNRPFTEQEQKFITTISSEFVEQWTRHGESVRGSFTILENQFLVFGVDQDFVEVSGCSIDASVKVVQQIQSQLGLDLLDKLTIAYKTDSGVQLASMPQFKGLIAEGTIDESVLVFNNMVNTKEGLETQWNVEAKNSWHKRFFV